MNTMHPPLCANPACLNAQIKRVQEQRAWLAEGSRWREHHLIVILYFEDATSVPFTFTSLETFTPVAPGALWIAGTAREHPPNVKRGYYGIARISSQVVPQQIQPN
ncbi:MAG: hypothetical protein AAB671_01605 [Patescibacteria group bacterium]